MERVAELRAELAEEGRPSFNDIIIKAAAMALRQHPMVMHGGRRIASGSGTTCT